MQKAISKYGLAAHLALLAVAPLFLYSFIGATWTARVVVWLCVAACAWLLMEPSRRKGEMLHDARARVFASIVADPLFWFSLVLLAVAAIRCLNSGVAMAYDAQTGLWTLRSPAIPFLPGSVDGSGGLPLATVAGVLVLMQAGRHALGKSARVCFVFLSSFFAGIAAVVLCIALFCGHDVTIALAGCSARNATYLGVAFGLYLSASPVALVGAFERKWKTVLPLTIVSMGGCGLGLYVFSPDFVILVFSSSTLVMLAIALVYAQRKTGGLVVPKCLAFIFIAALAGFLLSMGIVSDEVKSARLAWIFEDGGKLFPDSFIAMRDLLSSIAAEVWKSRPWNGSGLGSFGIDIRFLAKPEDWRMLLPGQTGALNGWWQMLAERGITGTVLFLSPLVFLAWTYFARFASAIVKAATSRHVAGILNLHPMCWLGPLLAVATALCGFIDHSFWRSETMMAVTAMFAMAGSAFPAAAKHADAQSETEK